MTYSPLTHLLYIPGSIINSGLGLRREAWDEKGHRLPPPPGGGRGIGYFRPGGEPRAGTLTAIDPTTNKIVWQKRNKYPMGVGSGLLSTASGLIFHGESDGRIVAYDIGNGNELWSFQTGAGADAPVITYAVGGQQYIAILSGGNSFQLSQRGDNLWAFKLGGTVPPAPAPAAPPTTQPGASGPPGR
jgi:alcohol dehydrogenase (cytochrome c)